MPKRTTASKKDSPTATKGKRLRGAAKVEQLTLKVTADLLLDLDALIALNEKRGRPRSGSSNTISAITRDAVETGLSLVWIECAYPELRSEVEMFKERLATAELVAKQRAAGDPLRRLPPIRREDAEIIAEVLGRADD